MSDKSLMRADILRGYLAWCRGEVTPAQAMEAFENYERMVQAEAREALLADDVIEIAACALFDHQAPAGLRFIMTQWEEAPEGQRDHFRSVARAVLTAALGIEGEQ